MYYPSLNKARLFLSGFTKTNTATVVTKVQTNSYYNKALGVSILSMTKKSGSNKQGVSSLAISRKIHHTGHSFKRDDTSLLPKNHPTSKSLLFIHADVM